MRSFWLGLLVGAVLTTILAAGLIYWRSTAHLETAARTNADFTAMQELWRACDAERKELTSAATVLYEFEPAKGIDLAHGLVTIQPGPALGGPAALGGQPMVRWYIPARVKPVVYGDAAGRAYAWYDRAAGKLVGPFAPEVQE